MIYYYIYKKVAGKWRIHDVTTDKILTQYYKSTCGKCVKVRKRFRVK